MKVTDIPGWMNETEIELLSSMAKDCNHWLELGAWCGRSTFAVISNLPVNGRITVIDPFANFDNFYNNFKPNDGWVREQFQKVLDWAKINRPDVTIKLIEKKSDESHLDVENQSIDKAFIDADHNYIPVLKDLLFCQEKVKFGGIISGHDYDHDHVRAAVKCYTNNKAKLFPGASIWETTNSINVNSPVRIKAYMITCPKRSNVLDKTLENLRATDWGEEPVIIMDHENGNQQINSLRLLRTAYAHQDFFDYVLFLEDDLDFNINIRHNLQNWPRLQNQSFMFGTLYGDRTSEHVQPVTIYDGDYSYNMSGHYCSQALLIHKKVIKYLIDNWSKAIGWQDIRFQKLLSQLFNLSWGSIVNLIQHQEVKSTWGGGAHSTPYFDKNYKR